jgi:hypothetical protein
MSAHRLYDTWFKRIRELLPAERITRVRNVAWMVVGLYLSQSVHLSCIARRLPFAAKLTSTTDRFRRVINNQAFAVRVWYRPIAEALLAEAARCGTVRLIVDGSKVGATHQLLMIALAYRKRALPIAWDWVKCARGHSKVEMQLELLQWVHSLVPDSAKVVLVGDCEFGDMPVAKQLDGWHWDYVLRQQGDTHVCVSRTQLAWQSFLSLVTGRDAIAWYTHAIVTIKHLHHTHLLAYWATGEKEPWLLMTSLPEAHLAVMTYRRRMWIEEMFGDWKCHGVRLEQTHLRGSAHLSRLVFLVALLYLWLVTLGARAIKAGARHLVDRKDRRDLSIFRIGLYLFDRISTQGRYPAIRLRPYFESVR